MCLAILLFWKLSWGNKSLEQFHDQTLPSNSNGNGLPSDLQICHVLSIDLITLDPKLTPCHRLLTLNQDVVLQHMPKPFVLQVRIHFPCPICSHGHGLPGKIHPASKSVADHASQRQVGTLDKWRAKWEMAALSV